MKLPEATMHGLERMAARLERGDKWISRERLDEVLDDLMRPVGDK